LVIGSADELGKDELVAENVNWISGNAPENPFRARLKIRYRAEQTWGMVIPEGPTRIRVNFENKLRDITPGQAAVVYNGDECLGGGIIQV
jgi:tRNA-specific 2-thiouridylase